jgi:hypothetical protein
MRALYEPIRTLLPSDNLFFGATRASMEFMLRILTPLIEFANTLDERSAHELSSEEENKISELWTIRDFEQPIDPEDYPFEEYFTPRADDEKTAEGVTW